MSLERRYSGPSGEQHVSTRLFATVVLFVAVVCLIGGYLLGRMERTEIKHTNEIISTNLTHAADYLFKKSRRVPPKAVHHSGPDKIQLKLHDLFQCSQSECGQINNYNLSEYVKNSINFQMTKLMRCIYNASSYLDSLR
ncbi:hypothetical protein ACJJTC_001085 [Scirpophaga incertulas]